MYETDNYIGVDGAKAIAETLKKNKTLRELWLGENKIGGSEQKKIMRDLGFTSFDSWTRCAGWKR